MEAATQKRELNKTELSLLLYLETRAVDHGGLVETSHMNEEDDEIAKRWNEEGFIKFGRVYSKHVKKTAYGAASRWVQFTEEAWEEAHKERKARADRMWEKRSWLKSDEK